MTSHITTGDPLFLALLRRAHLPAPVPEYRFHPSRRWRLDYAWPEYRVGLEVDGGVFTRGRHTRGTGWLDDTEKLNAAAVLGWRMLRCTPRTLPTLTLIDTIAATLARSTTLSP